MNILLLSTDRQIFDEQSPVHQRFIEYAKMVDYMYVIVLNQNSQPQRKLKIAKNCLVIPTNSKNKFFYFFDVLKLAFRFADPENGKQKIDLVSSQDSFELGLLAWLIKIKLKANLELQVHTDLFNPYFRKHSFSNLYRFLMARFLLPKADHIRVVSKRIIDSFPEKLKNKKITVVPIFSSVNFIQVQTPAFSVKEKYPQFKFIVLMMSRLESEKNIALAILSMKEVVRVFPKTALLIVGSGSQRNYLRRLARRQGLEQNIIFKSWTDDPISYFKTADLFLSASNYEGYGLSLVEAIVSKCPILTTKVGIVGEVLNGNSALLCEVGDKDCLVKSLKKAQQYPELLEDFKEKAYQNFIKKIPQTREENLALIKEGWLKSVESKEIR